jgi:hypothetical protein
MEGKKCQGKAPYVVTTIAIWWLCIPFPPLSHFLAALKWRFQAGFNGFVGLKKRDYRRRSQGFPSAQASIATGEHS